MSLWKALQEFNSATAEFKKEALRKGADPEVFQTNCPRCVFDQDFGALRGKVWAASKTTPGQFELKDFSSADEPLLWKRCADPFRKLVSALFPAGRMQPSYYALLLDFEESVSEAIGISNEARSSFTFAAFDRNPEAGAQAIDGYLGKGLSTTALLYGLKSSAAPISIEWRRTANLSTEGIWNSEPNLHLTFEGDSMELVGSLPAELENGLGALIEQLDGTGNNGAERTQLNAVDLKQKVQDHYKLTIEGYKKHVDHTRPTDVTCEHFLGIFLPAISERPNAAVFFLFDLTNKSTESVTDRLLLLAHVLSGNLNDWQLRLRELLLPKYTDDDLTNRILHGIGRMVNLYPPTQDQAIETDCVFGHDHLEKVAHAGQYNKIVEPADIQAEALTGDHKLKSLFRLAGDKWPGVSFYWEKNRDDYKHRPVPPDFVKMTMERIVGFERFSICPSQENIHFPCAPALPWLLALRALRLELQRVKDKNSNATINILATDRTASFVWARGIGHLRIPLVRDPNANPTLRQRWTDKCSQKYPPTQGVCAAIANVLHAKVCIKSGGSEQAARAPHAAQPVFDLYKQGTAEPICTVLVGPQSIHFYWTGPVAIT